jgi:hypothetical protein
VRRLVTLVAVVSLLAGSAAVAAEASTTRTPLMNSAPTLTSAEVLAWFRSVPFRPAYRATVSDAALVDHFRTEGASEGVDWNVAFAQAILETGWFNYPSAGQVRPEDNNFGGMGAFDGESGQNVFRFPTAQVGVRAKMQHLRIYGDLSVNSQGTNLGAPIAVDIDNRYPDRWRWVRSATGPDGVAYHGSALAWQDMGNGRWATDPLYSCKVLNLYRQMLAFNGRSTTGLPTNSACLRTWHLRNSNTGGDADQYAYLGTPGDDVLACDVDGDGRDTPVTFRDGVWTIAGRSDGSLATSVTYGRIGDLPLCGDWNSNGRDTLGIVRDGRWHLRNDLAGGAAQITFTYGRVVQGDIPIVGDWNGNGRDTPGIIRGGQWHLRNSLSGGPGEVVFIYGRILSGDRPLIGDWNGSGSDGVGIARDATREWHLRNTLTGGPAETVFIYGRLGRGDVAVVGDWNATGVDTPGIVR